MATNMDTVRQLSKARDALQNAFELCHREAINSSEQWLLTGCYEELKDIFNNIEKIDKDAQSQLVALKEDDLLQAHFTESLNLRLIRRKQLTQVKMLITPASEAAKILSTNLDIKPVKTAQLPKLKLPTFDGSYTEFTSFWDTIESDVLGGQYSDITKFNYIMGQLRGTAQEAVRGIHASGANLPNLISILMDRFGQKRKIIRAHANSVFDLQAPTSSHASLTKFFNSVNADLRSLEHLGVDMDTCSAFVVPILERKIPKQLLEKMGTCNQGDSFQMSLFWKAFQEQLENIGERHEVQSIQTSTKPSHQTNSNPSTTSVFAALSAGGSRNKCPFCDNDHFAVQCQLAPTQRLETAKNKKLCFCCLKKHPSGGCKAKDYRPSCRTCNTSRHHTALHDAFFSNSSTSGVTTRKLGATSQPQ